jgi:transposase
MGSAKPAFVNGIRTNRTGRRTYTDDFKLTVVRECSEPGVSLAAVAMAHRINANLVRRWVRHRGMPEAKAKEVAKLLPVTIEAERAVAGVDTGKRTNSNAAMIEIEVYGARIRLRGGVDVASLRSVLDVLAQR